MAPASIQTVHDMRLNLLWDMVELLVRISLIVTLGLRPVELLHRDVEVNGFLEAGTCPVPGFMPAIAVPAAGAERDQKGDDGQIEMLFACHQVGV